MAVRHSNRHSVRVCVLKLKGKRLALAFKVCLCCRRPGGRRVRIGALPCEVRGELRVQLDLAVEGLLQGPLGRSMGCLHGRDLGRMSRDGVRQSSLSLHLGRQ